MPKKRIRVRPLSVNPFVPLTINKVAAIIHLTNGYHALVDIELWEKIFLMGKWYFHRRPGQLIGYAVSGSNNTKTLHRVIMNAKSGQSIDHINRKGLDNRLENLRFATNSMNAVNWIRSNKHGYRGIQQQRSGRYQVMVSSKAYGTYSTKEEAARVYDLIAKKLHGEFAILNFPEHSDVK